MHKTLRLLGAGIHTAGPGKDYPSHGHTSWELVYYVRGRITCPVGAETYAATPGIAELTGYDSVSHLSRHVKAATGSAPGALRTAD